MVRKNDFDPRRRTYNVKTPSENQSTMNENAEHNPIKLRFFGATDS